MTDAPKLFIKTFPVGPFMCNCSIIGEPLTGKALLIDPGGDADKILSELTALDFKLQAIILTHAHLDHILATGKIKRATGVPIYLHQSDRFLWDTTEQQCGLFGLPYEPLPDPDHPLIDDQDLGCGGGVAIHTPGHTPGSMSFWFEKHKLLVAGDTLFQGSIGRTDLPGGDFGQIISSIRERLYCLDEDALVITGHGPNTTIGDEKNHNAFVRG